MTNKQLYFQFCQSTPNIPLFMQPWWMDAVCAGKQWDVLLETDEEGSVCAALPYLIRSRLRVRYIIMPQLTQMGGIWIREDLQRNEQQVLRICRSFTQQLKEMNLGYYYQQYPLYSPAPKMLEELGFAVKERVTYRIANIGDTDTLISTFSKNKRRQLQKAVDLRVDTSIDAEEFYRFHGQCLQERGKQISYSREFLLVLDRKTKRLGQSQVLAIRNADGELLAAAFLVWDNNTLYYLIPTYREAFKDTGASALLALESIKLARDKQLTFDFEGSMIRGVANHYKQFGSTATSYYAVEKYYHWWFRLAILWNWLRERKMR